MPWTSDSEQAPSFALSSRGLLLALWAFLLTLPMRAQTGPTILLDPAHGGSDTGATIADNLYERELTLAFANRLRSLLTARGFNVVLTHQTASDAVMSTDQRAEFTNHSNAIACLTLHATGSGNGVHLYTSALHEVEPALQATMPTPWNAAQAPYISRSLRLSSEFRTALTRGHVPVASGSTFLAPLDSFTCPAVAIELGPESGKSPQDSGYQQRAAEAIAGALLFWRGHPNAVSGGKR